MLSRANGFHLNLARIEWVKFKHTEEIGAGNRTDSSTSFTKKIKISSNHD